MRPLLRIPGIVTRYPHRMTGADDPDLGIYSIGAVARMLDVSPVTLRNWEERYNAVVPTRSPGGHRLYSRGDLERLRFVVAQTARGLSAADAHRMLHERLGSRDEMKDSPASAVPRLTILLAERDRKAAELSEYFLRTEGYDVSSAFDASEIEATDAKGPDLIILELMIFGGVGVDLCRRLKAEGSCPVLAISGLELRDTALEAGADAFLQKPFEALKLVSTVRDLLGTSALLGREAKRGK